MRRQTRHFLRFNGLNDPIRPKFALIVRCDWFDLLLGLNDTFFGWICRNLPATGPRWADGIVGFSRAISYRPRQPFPIPKIIQPHRIDWWNPSKKKKKTHRNIRLGRKTWPPCQSVGHRAARPATAVTSMSRETNYFMAEIQNSLGLLWNPIRNNPHNW